MNREEKVAQFNADLLTMNTLDQIKQYSDRRIAITKRFSEVVVRRMTEAYDAGKIGTGRNLYRHAAGN